MNTDSLIKSVESHLNSLLEKEVEFFLVEITIQTGNAIRILVDGDQGIPIGQLTGYHRALYKLLEENAVFPNNDFSLEVSSPGLDEPLKIKRQFEKNLNRAVEIILKDGEKVDGILLAINETELRIEETKGQGKKKEVIQHTISLPSIKTTKVQIKF